MEKIADVLIVGGGPAGLSAAINVIARGGHCVVLSNPAKYSPLWRAERVDNYSGMVGVSGSAMLKAMENEARDAGAQFVFGRVTAVLPFGDGFAATVNGDMVQGKRLLLATGAAVSAPMAGEDKWLGRGLSYCATCDGRLYRGRQVLVTGNAADLAEEAAFLHSVGCDVTVVTTRPVTGLDPAIPARTARSITLWEEENALRGLSADGVTLAAEGVFLLRHVTAPAQLLPGLEMEGAYIRVDRQMRTNIPGCYAAGDCTGQPLQVAKAVGEGLIAAQHAMRSLKA